MLTQSFSPILDLKYIKNKLEKIKTPLQNAGTYDIRGTTQLEENFLQLEKINGFNRSPLLIFTEKAPGSNSFFYVCQLTPSADSLQQG
jgi:hypothetical protein